MSRIVTFIVVALVAVVCLGWYLDWFTVSKHGTDEKPGVTVTIDKSKIKADEEKAKEKMQELGQKIKDKTSK